MKQLSTLLIWRILSVLLTKFWNGILGMETNKLFLHLGEFGSVMEGSLSNPDGTTQKVAVKTMKCKYCLVSTDLKLFVV